MSHPNNHKNHATIRFTLVGAALAVLCGWLLWQSSLGEPWENVSYDYLFRFGSHAVTNQLVFVEMNAGSARDFQEERSQHTKLLDKLTEDDSRLVVFDVLFRKPSADKNTDAELAAAMRRNGRVVLIADVDNQTTHDLESARLILPGDIFLNAAAGYGVGHADPQTGEIARRHWPFFSPGDGHMHSVGWAAAEIYGAHLDAKADRQWLRYYGQNGPGLRLTYEAALAERNGFFKNKIVFIGNWPAKPDDPGFKEVSNDKFSTPYTRWTNQSVGGMEIMATTFLNLVNGDWLRRPPAWVEFLILLFSGTFLGGGLVRLRPLPALAVAAGIFIALLSGFVLLSYFTNFWFPWLIIIGAQLPLALVWSWTTWTRQVIFFSERYPGYTTVGEPFGAGAYGKVWLVRNATGQLQALKEIQRAKFSDASPYDREFRGIKNYKPFSNEHPGLLHIDHVNRNEAEGYFYYVMELGDPLDPSWENNGGKYQPRDLQSVCRQLDEGQIPPRECLRIIIQLLEALEFLHQHDLVHRDIKPANIVFVNGRPKLADVGLVREPAADATWVGTDFFMPPPPEPPGTKTADIYAMSKVLYVISTGKSARSFSELPTALVAKPEFMRLNEIICCACHPLAENRYHSATEMLAALRRAQTELDEMATRVL